MRFYYIYKITNLVNNKVYIGKTHDVKKRWRDHKRIAKIKTKGDYAYFHKAINKHGDNFFKVEVIDKFQSEKDCFEAECNYINYYKSNQRKFGYNLTEGGDGCSGYRHTKESLELMSSLKKGSYIGTRNPFYGKNHSEKTKRVLSENKKAQNIVGVRNPFYDKKHSKESILLMIKNHRNKERYLSEKDLEDIEYKKNVLKITYLEIAKIYGMHWKSISNAVHGKRAYSSMRTEEEAK